MSNTVVLDKPKKKENLKQRAYLNSVTSVLDYGAKAVTGFVVTPFLVTGLGNMLFGVWQVLGQFTSYTNLADIRATQVLKWAIAKDRDIRAGEELREYVTATFLLVLLILPVFLVAGTFITWYAPVITRVGVEYYSTVRIACALLVFALVTKKLFSIFESILRGMNLGFKRMGFRAFIYVFGGGLKILVVVMGYGLIGLALVQIVVALVIGITVYVIVKKHIPWFGFGRTDIQRSLAFLKISGWFMCWTGTKLILLSSDKILLGYIAGPVMVTQYVITKYLVDTVRGVVNNVVHGVLPGFGKLYGNGEFNKLLKVREHAMLLTWILAVTIGATVIAFNESFILLWIGENQFAGQLINLLITLVIVQYIFIENDSAIINTTLDLSQKVYMGLASAIISVGLIVFLVGDYGIAGLCIGIIAGRLVMSIGYPYLIHQKTGKRYSYSNIPFRTFIVTGSVWGSVYWMSTFIEIKSWFILIVSVGLFMSMLSPILFLIGLSKKQRLEILMYKSKIKLFNKVD